MWAFRKYLLVVLPIVGFFIFISAHLADEHSLIGTVGSPVSFLFFLAALAFALMPERQAVSPDEPKPVPRTLSRDVLNDQGLAMSLPQRIEAATELSKMSSRTLGVIAIRIDEIERVSEDLGTTVEDVTARASAAMRRQLRGTDRAVGNGPDELLVCLPLIAVRSDLNTIAARLSRAAVAALSKPKGEDASEAGPAPTIDLGMAMYPIDGYRGDDLIATAQANAKTARAARLGRPTRRGAADPLPVMPPRKPTRPPRARRQSAPAASARSA